MATLTVKSSARAANALTMVVPSGSDKFPNTGREMVLVDNSASSDALTISIPTPQTVDGLAVGDRTIVVPAGEKHLLGPFPSATYRDSDGFVTLTTSGAGIADALIAVIKQG